MEKLRQAFLSANAGVDIIERCSLPYIYFPDDGYISNSDCCLDVFFILDGPVELIFNQAEKKEISSGDFILLNRKKNDYFILSGKSEAFVLHAKVRPCGFYLDLILCQGSHEHLHLLIKGVSEILPAAAEMMKLLFRLSTQKEKKEASLLLEIPIAIFFIQLYLIETTGPLFTLHDPGHRLAGLILEIINKPGHQWRVKDMARKCNMSTNFFISEFKKISGHTPLNFLKKIRLNRGRRLLENTETPVSVIASECGYSSHASFTFYIKKEFGMSPMKIRKSYKFKDGYFV
ncbi:helix-turn-helix transcriptional regulator [Citrobacter portucalensis]|uniref:helix-turn-helix transcriptional regulator n=1 Tax=Citrobacter portucalensis TaxID=1639133 RepID=UPI0039FBED99|nr:AraC family transcriptional regulator [Salmonella enterica]